MKKRLIGITTCLAFLGIAGTAQAALTTIGTAQFGGTGTEYNLIWDDDNNGKSVVWFDFTNDSFDYSSWDSWQDQKDWAAGLNSTLIYNIDTGYTINWGGSSWRLPSAGANPINGYYQITSEMGHLYYEELGLQSYPDRGNIKVTASELNASNFDNFIASSYWSETMIVEQLAYDFSFAYGYQSAANTFDFLYGIAIRDAEVSAVPIPGAIWLLGSGLAALMGKGLRRKKNA